MMALLSPPNQTPHLTGFKSSCEQFAGLPNESLNPTAEFGLFLMVS
jgi:hypothetical protein